MSSRPPRPRAPRPTAPARPRAATRRRTGPAPRATPPCGTRRHSTPRSSPSRPWSWSWPPRARRPPRRRRPCLRGDAAISTPRGFRRVPTSSARPRARKDRRGPDRRHDASDHSGVEARDVEARDVGSLPRRRARQRHLVPHECERSGGQEDDPHRLRLPRENWQVWQNLGRSRQSRGGVRVARRAQALPLPRDPSVGLGQSKVVAWTHAYVETRRGDAASARVPAR